MVAISPWCVLLSACNVGRLLASVRLAMAGENGTAIEFAVSVEWQKQGAVTFAGAAANVGNVMDRQEQILALSVAELGKHLAGAVTRMSFCPVGLPRGSVTVELEMKCAPCWAAVALLGFGTVKGGRTLTQRCLVSTAYGSPPIIRSSRGGDGFSQRTW